MKAKVTLALIRNDYTWTEKVIEVIGASWSNCIDNAKLGYQYEVGYFDAGKYPENIIAISAINGTRTRE